MILEMLKKKNRKTLKPPKTVNGRTVTVLKRPPREFACVTKAERRAAELCARASLRAPGPYKINLLPHLRFLPFKGYGMPGAV